MTRNHTILCLTPASKTTKKQNEKENKKETSTVASNVYMLMQDKGQGERGSTRLPNKQETVEG